MKNLIIYFSWSGNTKKIVEEINKEMNFDVVRLERKMPYSKDYHECAYVQAREEYEKKIHPEINALGVDAKAYNKILLFFPIWWYIFPMPVATLIESLKGYKGEIQVFANSYTNDPHYMENSMNDLQQLDKDINFTRGLFNRPIREHLNLIKGDS